MKKNRILGILWLAFCSYSSFNLLQALQSLHPVAPGQEVARYVLASLCLIFLAGIVGSIFLFREATWARWIVSLVAIIVALGTLTFIVIYWLLPVVTYRSLPVWFPVWCSVTSIFALVSLVLLFSPRHEPVA